MAAPGGKPGRDQAAERSRERERALERLDRELSGIVVAERCSFGAELRAQLVEEHRRARSPQRRTRPLLAGIADRGRRLRDRVVRDRVVRDGRAWSGFGHGPPARGLLAASVAVVVVLGLMVAVPGARAALLGFVGVSSPTDARPPEPGVARAGPAPADVEAGSSAPDVDAAAPSPPIPESPMAVQIPTITVGLPETLPELVSREAARRIVQDAYPVFLQQAGIGGQVRLLLWVDADGRVAYPRVEESSGVGALDSAALRASRSFEFVPAARMGRPVGGWVSFSIVFEPTEPAGSAAPQSEQGEGAGTVPPGV